MFVMFGEKDGRRVAFIGLTQANLERLPAEPILFRGPHALPVQDFVILTGPDKLAIMKQLEAAGIEFSQDMKDAVALDPS